MINQPESIPLYQAINMVGMAMYGAAWIAQLTDRERWLLERYAQPEATKMLVQRSATDLGTFEDWSSKDVPPSLQPEVESAIDRRDWQLSQWRKVREWLTQRGFYCTRRDVRIKGKRLERDRFERAFTTAFPTHEKPRPLKAGSSNSGFTAGIRTNRDADAEAACGEWLNERVQKWKEGGSRLSKAVAFEAAKEAVKTQGALSYNAFERAWARNVPQEWRRAGAPKGIKHKNRRA